MPDLIAQGVAPEHRWRRRLPADRACIVGREAGFWSTPWDNRISRLHAELCWHEGSLRVRRLPQSRNPIFVRGQEAAEFAIAPGEHFVIGDTTFSLADERLQVSLHLPLPMAERTFSAQDLKALRFHDADQRIDLLGRIPEIISGAATDEEMFVRLASILLSGIPRAAAVALVSVERGQPSAPVRALHWDRRLLSDSDFQPSEPLIRRAVETAQSVVHVWRDGGPADATAATPAPSDDWAFCTPVPGDACRGWAFYVQGHFRDQAAPEARDPIADLRDDLKFTEVIATAVCHLRQARLLERSQSSLRQFLSPVVLDALAGRDPDSVLAPRETDVSVMFCDLRGFSRRSEQAAGDLFGLLRRVSDALGIMTRQILDTGGVVGDFHGDAAMGFWGWPLAQSDAVGRACRAALAIRREFELAARQTAHPLADFRIGIGLASGRAVAGKIGTVDQVKVTAFGPVVNRASRLEGMTKQLHAAILLDAATAAAVRQAVPASVARVRRLAIVRPYGLDAPLEISELLPPAAETPHLNDQAIVQYESALDALLEGRWSAALQLLHRVPADDQVKDFLTVFIAQHNRVPPAGWDGVIPLPSK